MTAALIVSAGKTERKGRFTPERQIGNISAIERIALTFQLAGIQRIVVVQDEERIPERYVASMNLVFLTVSSKGEMFDSIKQGLEYLEGKCEQVIVAHVDVPMFSKSTLELLMDAKGKVCIPSYYNKCGHPILLRSNCFAPIMLYEGPGGLKGATVAAGITPEIIPVEDEGILFDAQSETPYEELAVKHEMSNMRATFQLRIGKEKVFYGPGAHHLLQLTEELGSLASACQHMGMSYTKGRKIISTMEEQLGTPVLETRQGGRSGGSSKLTEEAKQMMSRYQAFHEEAEEILQQLFQKYYT